MAAIDSADRAMRCLDESDWPLIAKLHGDYQSIAIKNTGLELEKQDARMRHVLVEAGKSSEMLLRRLQRTRHLHLGGVERRPGCYPLRSRTGSSWVASSASRLLPARHRIPGSRAEPQESTCRLSNARRSTSWSPRLSRQPDLPPALYDRVMEGATYAAPRTRSNSECQSPGIPGAALLGNSAPIDADGGE